MTGEQKFEQKPNTGALFKNTRKHSETDAEYTGSVDIEGRQFWLTAWVNEAKSGRKYLRVRVKPKAAPDDDDKPTPEFNDEIPW